MRVITVEFFFTLSKREGDLIVMQNARTVRVSPSFTSDSNAVRTSGVANTSNKIIMITSTHNLPLLS